MLNTQMFLCECIALHAIEIVWMALEKVLNKKATAKRWEDVLNMTIYGMKKIMGSAEVKNSMMLFSHSREIM